MFSSSLVSINTPPTNQTIPAAEPTSMVTTGTIVGIAIGASLLFLGSIALFVVYWKRQRRSAREDEDKKSPSAKPSPSYTTIISNHPTPTYTTDYKGQLPAYEPRDSAEFASNADYYDRLSDVAGPRRSGDEPAPADLSALPAHPAYIPRGPSRSTSRVPSPNLDAPSSPPQQPQYLSPKSTNSSRMPPPPPLNMRGSPHAIPLSSYSMQSHQAGSPPAESLRGRPSPQSSIMSVVPPPPPPPPSSQSARSSPALILPSVPRIRIPKKYVPPQIHVQDATPIDPRTDMDISLPIAYVDERFREDQGIYAPVDPVGGRSASRASNRPAPLPPLPRGADGQVIEHFIDQNQTFSPLPIVSGKTLLYG